MTQPADKRLVTEATLPSYVTGNGTTKTALDAAYKSRTGTKAVGQGELTLNAADYGLVGDTTTQSLTALNAAITAAAAKGPVSVYFPRPTTSSGYYAFTQPLPNVSNVRIFGDGMSTQLRWTSGNMLALSGTVERWTFEDIGLANSGTAGHIIDLGSTATLMHVNFNRVEIFPRVPTASIIHMDDSTTQSCFDIHFKGCLLWRQPTHTVPGIDVKNSSSGVNTWSITGGQWHSNNCNTTPMVRIESLAAQSYVAGFTFTDIVGEQNLGGMVHLFGANRVMVNNVVDFDGNNYTDDMFKFGTSSAGLACQGVVYDNIGTPGIVTFAAGKGHVSISGGTGHSLGRISHAGQSLGVVNIPATGRVVRHGGGLATSARIVSASTSFGGSDSLIVGNGSSLTITLPDPTALLSSGTVPVGREFAVKNIHASTLTVTSAGAATVDGAPTKTFAQYAGAKFITDGTNWHIVGAAAAPASDPDPWALAVGDSTMPRGQVSSLSLAMTSGTMRISYFRAASSRTVNQVRLICGTTAAGATPTLVRAGVYSVDASWNLAALLGATANDPTVFASASTSYTRSITTPFPVVAGTWYAFGVLVVTGAAAPTVPGQANTAGLTTEAFVSPPMCSAVASLADLPTSGAVSVSGNRPYAVLI